MSDEQITETLRFEPPALVYSLSLLDQGAVDPIFEKSDLTNKLKVAIPSPWNQDRFLPATAYGKDDQFILDLGTSFGALIYDEKGWQCVALIPKRHIVNALINDFLKR